jgi:hypothetical protein
MKSDREVGTAMAKTKNLMSEERDNIGLEFAKKFMLCKEIYAVRSSRQDIKLGRDGIRGGRRITLTVQHVDSLNVVLGGFPGGSVLQFNLEELQKLVGLIQKVPQ